MALKLAFAAQQYAQFLVLVLVAWGLGRTALRLLHPPLLQGPFRHGVPLATGLGATMVLLQGLAIAGWLKPAPLIALGVFGFALAALEAVRCRRRRSLRDAWGYWLQLPMTSRLLSLAVLALGASTLPMPLAPPVEWDELMYHLPHASQWAASGHLTVNEWLRYPWFPYNYELLYAVALVAGNDVLPHLMHALAGWTTTLLLLAWARQRAGLDRALLAALLWLFLASSQFGNAYVDLGVALFVFLSYVALDAWLQERTDAWLVVSAFALGVAVGSKYQALGFLPFFLVAVWKGRPSPRWFVVAVVAFLLPCAYWYSRNLVLAGDPFAPFGGRLFGFTDWNVGDYTSQFDDLRRQAALPPYLLWPALITLVLQLRAPAGARLPAAFAAWALVFWAATSRYPRYLLPVYPVLALLAVLGWEQIARLACRMIRRPWLPARWADLGAAGVLVLVLSIAHEQADRWWGLIAPTPEMREASLARQLPGYPMLQYLRDHPQGRIYQIGLEGEIHYAPQPIWGDHFGPWRYRDYLALDASALRRRLVDEGFDALLVHTGRMKTRAMVLRPEFTRNFALEHQERAIMLFSVRKEPRP